MKLSTINITEWTSVVNNITFQEDNDLKRSVLENVLSVIYWKNYNRSFRSHLTNSWKEFLQYYLVSNKLKIDYILSTQYKDFLQTISTSRGQDTDNSFNIDYYGGEGQTGKATGEVSSEATSLNLKDKARNFYDISHNSLFKFLVNLLFDTYIEGEDWNEVL